MKIRCYAYTTKFFKKALNEDGIFVIDCVLSDGYFHKNFDLDEFTLAVCDGVSGADKGYYASQYILQHIANGDYSGIDELRHLLIDINQSLIETGVKINARDMSSTLAGIHYKDQELSIFHVGDSRVYKATDKEVVQLTNDDTVANKLFQDGVISKKEIETHPQKNVLVDYFGNQSYEFKIKIMSDKEFKNSSYLITSDGISDFIKEDKMKMLLNMDIDGFDKIRLIVGEAINSGSNDDMSVILMEVPNE